MSNTASAPSPDVNSFPALIDEYGLLASEVALFRASKLKRFTELGALFQSTYVNESADLNFYAQGNQFCLLISEKSHERMITSMRKIYRRLGIKGFLAICTIPFKLLDQLFTPDEQKDFMEVSRSGSRTIKAVLKP